eukprot:TRINITY_DN20453_c0_g1_i3.p1 TRINITY_DN20453_c0_g1~~TRINITY_DN20453_c0_g1_i3.p1  ORF type:complete len:196 (+),score=36.06 TRINITY_DN20453_c0_g1_i3:2-589(+)
MATPPPPSDFLVVLPKTPLDQPYCFLSARQKRKCEALPELRPYAAHLPGWVPQRRIGAALGFGPSGVDAAMAMLGSAYVWATELENVHTTWDFDEPALVLNGNSYSCSEELYHAQKPRPFNGSVWREQRLGVMRTAVRLKFDAAPELKPLLLATHPHALLSLKDDDVWGVKPDGHGQNLLAKLWMELRDELMTQQ